MQHLETCLLIAEAQSFMSTYTARYQDSCYSLLVCLFGLWLRNSAIVKVIENPILDGIIFKNELTLLHLAGCVRAKC